MELKSAIHRAVSRWAAKKNLPQEVPENKDTSFLKVEEPVASLSTDDGEKSRKNVRRTDRIPVNFVHEHYSLCCCKASDDCSEQVWKEKSMVCSRTILLYRLNTVCLNKTDQIGRQPCRHASLPIWYG